MILIIVVYAITVLAGSCDSEFEIQITISDGPHVVITTLTCSILARLTTTITVFPNRLTGVGSEYLPQFYPNLIRDSHILYEVESAPSHGVLVSQEQLRENISTPLTRFTGDTSIFYLPLLTDHSLEKLCRRVDSQSIQDRVVLSAYHSQTTLSLTNQRVYFNISFLHFESAIDHNQTDIYLQSGDKVVIERRHVSNLLESHRSLLGCNSGARGGFIIGKLPQFGKLVGLDRHGIIWWDVIITGQFSYEHNRLYQITDSIALTVILEQDGRRHVVSEATVTLNLHILADDSEHDLLSETPRFITQTIWLLQGETSSEFAVKSPEKPYSNGQYLISQAPKHGRILSSNNKIIINFQPEELLTYEQVEMTSSDSFLLHMNTSSRQVLVIVSIKPNIVPNSPLVVSGFSPTPITERSLDAGPLLQIVPHSMRIVYSVSKPPFYGSLEIGASSIVKRSTGTAQHFSHEDVINGRVVYYPPREIPDVGEDNFEYILTAPGVQPASGVFHVQFSANFSSIVDKEQITKSANSDGTYLTLALAVGSVLLIVFISVITAVCIRRGQPAPTQTTKPIPAYEEEPRLILAKENGSYKLLIAGCDDFAITPHSLPPSPSRCMDETKSSEISRTVPEVRVTPLISADGTCYDLHDYVNYDDLLTYKASTSSQHADNVTRSSADLDFGEKSNQEGTSSANSASIEDMPPIKRPNYSC